MVATLKASGTRRVYGIPGDSLNGFTDAMRRAGGIVWQHVRHEEAAAFAAAAEAALTGELAVCAASCGPGNLHLINGLFDANRSRVPVLAIAAQIPEEEIGSEYFQETHPQNLFRECSVYCELVSEPEQMPRVLEIAMRTALARGGVSVVVIPGGVFFADVPSGAKAVPVRAATAVIRPDDSSLAAAAEVLNSAQRVTILAGAGCAGAHQQLIELAGASGRCRAGRAHGCREAGRLVAVAGPARLARPAAAAVLWRCRARRCRRVRLYRPVHDSDAATRYPP
jgi:pyruvate dehydrogenase (quinone)